MSRRDPTRSLSPHNLRKLVRDKRTHVTEAIVVKPPDEEAHWEVVDGMLLVHCEETISRKPYTCRMPGAAIGRGVLMVPPVGTIVGVIVPGGSVSADPMIVAWFESGTIPDEFDENVVLVCGPNVTIVAADGGKVRLGSGDANQSVVRGEELKTAYDALASAFASHFHLDSTALATTGPIDSATPPAGSPPVQVPGPGLDPGALPGSALSPIVKVD